MIGEVLAGISALSSLFGSLKSAGANRAIDRQLQKRQSELDTWYNKEYNMNYLDTEEAKSVAELLGRNRDQAMKKVDQSNAIKGASDETRVATADKINRSVGDELTQLAGYGTRYKDMIRREYQGLKSNLDDLEFQNLQNKSAQWSNFMNNSMTAGMGFSQAAGEGAFKGWEDWWKNRQKGKILNKAGGMVNPVSTSHLKVPKLSN